MQKLKPKLISLLLIQEIISQADTPVPYLLYINSQGSVQWSKQFPSSFDYIDVVMFDIQNHSKILAALNYVSTQASTLFIFQNTGELLHSYKLQYQYSLGGTLFTEDLQFQWTSDSIIYSGNNLIIGGRNSASNYGILKFQIGTPPISLSYQIEHNTGQVYVMKQLDDLTYFTGGYDAKDTSGIHAVISKYSENPLLTTETPAQDHISFYNPYSLTSYFYIRRLDAVSGTSLVALSENIDPSQGLQFTYCDLDILNTFTSCSAYLIQDGYRSIKAYSVKNFGQIFWAYVQVDNSFKALKMTPSSFQWIELPLSGGIMSQGYIVSENEGYYIGKIKAINSISTISSYTYNYQQGFLMTFGNSASSCIRPSSVVNGFINYPNATTLETYFPPISTHSQMGQEGKSGESLYLASSTGVQDLTLLIQSSKLWCTAEQTIRTPTIHDQFYILGQSALVLSFSEFETSSSCSDAIWIYSVEELIGTVPQSLPLFITFSEKQFSIESSDLQFIGTHFIRVTGILNNLQTATVQFTLTVTKEQCSNSLITSQTLVSPQNYNIDSGVSLNLGPLRLTQSLSYCPSISYEIIDLATGYAADSIFSIQNGDPYVQTDDKLKIGSYSIQIKGVIKEGSVTYASETQSVIVNIYDQCSQSYQIASEQIDPIDYDIRSATSHSIQISDKFSLTKSIECASQLDFKIKDITNGQIKDINNQLFSFDVNSLVISTNSHEHLGTYLLQVTANLHGYSFTNSITFAVNIIDSCDNIQIQTVSLISPQQYDIQSGLQLSLGSTLWSTTNLNAGCPGITYSLVQKDDRTNNIESIFFIENNQLYVKTNEVKDMGTYNLIIKGKIQSYKLFDQESVQISVDIVSSNEECSMGILSVGTLQDVIYDIQADQRRLITTNSIFTYSLSDSHCSKIDLDLKLLVNNVETDINSSIFKIENDEFYVETKKPSSIGIYNLRLYGLIKQQGKFKYIDFQVQIIDGCDNVEMHETNNHQPDYYINIDSGDDNNEHNLGSIDIWQTDMTQCGDITYELVEIDDNQDEDGNEEQSEQQDGNEEQSEQQDGNEEQSEQQDGNEEQSEQKDDNENSKDKVDKSNENKDLKKSYFSISSEKKLIFKYKEKKENIKDEEDNQTDYELKGQYNIKIVGTMRSSDKTYKTQEKSIKINLQDNCQSVQITKQTIHSQTFDISAESNKVIGISNSLKLSQNNCISLKLALKDISSGNEQDYDHSIFKFDKKSITINTQDYNKLKTYQLRLKGYNSDLSKQDFIDFDVTIQDSCNEVQMTQIKTIKEEHTAYIKHNQEINGNNDNQNSEQEDNNNHNQNNEGNNSQHSNHDNSNEGNDNNNNENNGNHDNNNENNDNNGNNSQDQNQNNSNDEENNQNTNNNSNEEDNQNNNKDQENNNDNNNNDNNSNENQFENNQDNQQSQDNNSIDNNSDDNQNDNAQEDNQENQDNQDSQDNQENKDNQDNQDSQVNQDNQENQDNQDSQVNQDNSDNQDQGDNKSIDHNRRLSDNANEDINSNENQDTQENQEQNNGDQNGQESQENNDDNNNNNSNDMNNNENNNNNESKDNQDNNSNEQKDENQNSQDNKDKQDNNSNEQNDENKNSQDNKDKQDNKSNEQNDENKNSQDNKDNGSNQEQQVENNLGSVHLWQKDLNQCPEISYQLIDIDTGNSVDSLFQISTNGELLVQTADKSKKGAYNIMIVGSIKTSQRTYITKESRIKVNLLDKCDAATIVKQSISKQRYDIISESNKVILSSDALKMSEDSCTEFQLELKDITSGTEEDYDHNVFKIQSKQVILNTQNYSNLKSYKLRVKAIGYNQQQSMDFDVEVYDSCEGLTITKQPIQQQQEYDIYIGLEKTLVSLDWQTDSENLKTINFEIIDLNTNQPANPMFYVSQKSLKVKSTNSLNKGIYNLKIIGKASSQYKTYKQEEITLQVRVFEKCRDSTIFKNQITQTTFEYDIQSRIQKNIISNVFYLYNPQGCPQISYNIKQIHSNGDEAQDDGRLFKITDQSLNLMTNLVNDVNTYVLKAYVSLEGYNDSNSIELTVRIYDSCDQVKIIKNDLVSEQTYDIQSRTIQRLGTLSYTRDLSQCSLISYKLLNAQNDQEADSIFSISTDNQFEINTFDTSKVGIYSLKIVGSVQSEQKLYKQESQTIQINITDSCKLTKIIKKEIPLLTLYDIANGTKILADLSGWSQTLLYCPLITYQIQDEATGHPYEKIFGVSNNQIQILTNDPNDSGLYKLKVLASVPTYTQELVYFDVQIFDCKQSALKANAISQLNYYIGSQPTLYSFNDWSNTLQYCGEIQYSIRISPQTSSITIIKQSISISSKDSKDIGIYQVALTGSLNSGVQKQIQFSVQIQPVVNTAPYFQNAKSQGLIDQINVEVGQQKVYNLPQIFDNQGDKVELKLDLIQNIKKELPSSIQLNGQSLQINPVIGDEGLYNIQVTLTDNGNPSLSSSYFLHINVFKDAQRIEELKPTTQGQGNQIQSNGQKSVADQLIYDELVNLPKKNPIKVKIIDFDDQGLVTIKLINIEQYTFNSGQRLLQEKKQVQIKFYMNDDKSKELTNYEVVSFEDGLLKIRLLFENPLEVSQFQVPDKVTVEVVLAQDMSIKFDKAIQYMPQQKPTNGSTLYIIDTRQAAITYGVAQASQSLIILLVFLSLFYYESLSALWSYLHSIQLILHLALFNLSLPSNLITYFKAFFKITTFNLFNPITFHQAIYNLEDQSDYSEYTINFRNLGYKQSNFIYNLGFIFLLIEIYLILSPFIILISRLKFFRSFKITRFIDLHFFFSGTSRFVIESSLFILIASIVNIISDNSDHQSGGDKFSLFVSYAFMILYLTAYIFITLWIFKHKNKIDLKNKSLIRFLNLLQDLNLKKEKIVIPYYMIFLARRLVLILTIFTLKDQLGLQLMIFQILNIGYLIYYVKVKPMSSKRLNKLEIFNQFSVLLIGHIFFIFSDIFQKKPETNYIFGELIIAMCMAHLLMNIIYIIVYTFIPLVRIFIAKITGSKSLKHSKKADKLKIIDDEISPTSRQLNEIETFEEFELQRQRTDSKLNNFKIYPIDKINDPAFENQSYISNVTQQNLLRPMSGNRGLNDESMLSYISSYSGKQPQYDLNGYQTLNKIQEPLAFTTEEDFLRCQDTNRLDSERFNTQEEGFNREYFKPQEENKYQLEFQDEEADYQDTSRQNTLRTSRGLLNSPDNHRLSEKQIVQEDDQNVSFQMSQNISRYSARSNALIDVEKDESSIVDSSRVYNDDFKQPSPVEQTDLSVSNNTMNDNKGLDISDQLEEEDQIIKEAVKEQVKPAEDKEMATFGFENSFSNDFYTNKFSKQVDRKYNQPRIISNTNLRQIIMEDNNRSLQIKTPDVNKQRKKLDNLEALKRQATQKDNLEDQIPKMQTYMTNEQMQNESIQESIAPVESQQMSFQEEEEESFEDDKWKANYHFNINANVANQQAISDQQKADNIVIEERDSIDIFDDSQDIDQENSKADDLNHNQINNQLFQKTQDIISINPSRRESETKFQ